MKIIYLTILLFFLVLVVPGFVFAANYNDVSVSASTVITVAGINLTVSGTASIANITVNASDFTVGMLGSSQLVVTSVDKRLFTVSPAEYMRSLSCEGSVSTLTLIDSSDAITTAKTVTVTPLSSTCSTGGGGGAGGGGGGGGGYVAPSIPVQTPATTTLALVPALPATAPTIPAQAPSAAAVSPVFSTGLSKGMTNSDVKRLQQLLNSDSDTKIAETGVGSSGNETEYFGSLTEKAVQKFQVKYGVANPGDDGYGYVGPKTRAKIQEVFTQTETSVPAPEPTPTPAPAPEPTPSPSTPTPPAISYPSSQSELPDFLKLFPAPSPQ